MRDMHAGGTHSQTGLADSFGISKMVVGDIVRRKAWGHI